MRSRTAPGAPRPGEHSGGPGGGRGAARPAGTSPRAGTAPVGGLRPPLSYGYCEGRGGPGQGSHGEQLTVHEHGRSTPCAPGGRSSPPRPSSQGRSGSRLPVKWHTLKPTSLLLFFGGASPTVQGCMGTGRQPSPQHRADAPVPSAVGCRESRMSTRNSPALLGGERGDVCGICPSPGWSPTAATAPWWGLSVLQQPEVEQFTGQSKGQHGSAPPRRAGGERGSGRHRLG